VDSASSATYNNAIGISTTSVIVTRATPAVTVSPGSTNIMAVQPLTVTGNVSDGSGNPIPTGTVTLTSGSYSSGVVTLSNGAATVNMPAGSLGAGSDILATNYTPDTAGANIYNSATGYSSAITVTQVTPTVTVTPAYLSITPGEVLYVYMTVSGGSGAPAATGSMKLTSGNYSSGPVSVSGSTSFNIPAGSLTTGVDSLLVSYTPGYRRRCDLQLCFWVGFGDSRQGNADRFG